MQESEQPMVVERAAERLWISVTRELPEPGARVEVWVVEDRLDPDGTERYHADYGQMLRTDDVGKQVWLVGADWHAVVTHWRPSPRGPWGWV